MPYGAVIWLTADEGLVSALGLSKSASEYPLSIHAYALASHLVYGLTIEIVRGAVRRALNPSRTAGRIFEVVYTFPDAVVTWTVSAGRSRQNEFSGTKGTMDLTRDGFEVTPEVMDKKPLMEVMVEPKSEMDTAHVRNFLDAVKTRKASNTDVAEGHLTATMCHMGNIATRLGRTLKWDAVKEKFIDDKEVNALLSKPYRGT